MVSMPLLMTKMHPPAPSTQLVTRPHLVAYLDNGIQEGHKLTLISAPAGFGKTNLLVEWAGSVALRKKVAWLSLNAGDNLPTRFWAYVVSAIQSVLPGVGEASAALLRSAETPSFEVILTPLLNDIAVHPEPLVLVLDDYHLISRDEIHLGVDFLMEHLPSRVHLVISTRADPPLSLVRMRAHGQLTELRESDIRFTYAESSNYLNQRMGLNLSELDLLALDARLQGWIAGLQLAALSMRGRSDQHEFVRTFSGSHRYIVEYLAEEVLNNLPTEVVLFLEQTSIFDQFCAELCDQVTGRKDGQEMLSRLFHENLFITALDFESTWYCYHPLFSDLLRNRLQQKMGSQEIANLHQLASQWYQQHGFLQIAVGHAQQAGDVDRVADLVEQAVEASLLDSWMTNLLVWLEELPKDVVRSRLRLRVYQACALFFDGQISHCLEVLQETMQEVQELLSSPENQILQEELFRLIDITYAFINGLEISLQGKFDQSKQTVLNSIELAEEAGNVFLLAHAYEGLALSLYHRGELREAEATSRHLIELAGGGESQADSVRPLPIASTGYLLLANIALDQNKLNKMKRYVSKALDLSRESGGAKSLVEAYVMQSRLQQALGEQAAAYHSLKLAARAYHLKASRVTRFRLESQKARLDLERGALDEVNRWIRQLAETVQDSTVPLPTMFFEVVQLILASVYLYQKQPDKALRVLEGIQEEAAAENHYRHLIEIHALKALAFLMLKQKQMALDTIGIALRMAEGPGIKRVFLDSSILENGGSMADLLSQAVETGIAPGFTSGLLAVFLQKENITSKVKGKKLVEPLSKREVEVLEHLAMGMNNREIAEQLVISLDTVKTHTGNIYSKLGVHNRTQAVVMAKNLGLIDK